MGNESEAELNALMARLASGDRSAFEPLYRSLSPRALRLARARIETSNADDVAQAALLRVFASAHRFEAGRPVLPWFYAIVANEVRAARRDAARSRQLVSAAELQPESQPSLEDDALRRELEGALQQALAGLDDVSASAIGALLGREQRPSLGSATFRKRVSRAYARLRKALGELS